MKKNYHTKKSHQKTVTLILSILIIFLFFYTLHICYIRTKKKRKILLYIPQPIRIFIFYAWILKNMSEKMKKTYISDPPRQCTSMVFDWLKCYVFSYVVLVKKVCQPLQCYRTVIDSVTGLKIQRWRYLGAY